MIGSSLVLAAWILVAQTTALHCRGTVCQPAPGTGLVQMTVSTVATQEACARLRQQMQGTGNAVMQLPTQVEMSFRQTTTLTCQKGD